MYYDKLGNAIERIAIKSVQSWWDKPGFNEDRSNDIALVRLVSESISPTTIAGMRYGEKTSQLIVLTAIGFHADMSTINRKIIRKVTGVGIDTPSGSEHAVVAARKGEPFRNSERLISANLDSGHGLSGGPVFNFSGKVIGIIQGSIGTGGNVFNAKSNYNLIIRLDETIRSEINRFVAIP